jgi:enoyl-[acyl-carrier protein] reductase II
MWFNSRLKGTWYQIYNRLFFIHYKTVIFMSAAFSNRITQLFHIDYPIIQAGMIWASGWRLASAVSNAGGLGIIGSGSMYPPVLREHIQKYKAASAKPFAVNVPLLYADIDKHIDIIIEEKVPIVFTSAGNPKTWTQKLKDQGITVVHVVSSSKFAVKSQEAGCDAVVAEGFEAGGHNGREETTTLCLIPSVVKAVDIPVLAAGGIYDGKTMLATMLLGAEGVQIGSRFVATEEASSHIHFKEALIKAGEGDTQLTMKQLTPVRLLKNKFYNDVQAAEANCATKEEMQQLLGRARAKKGMFEGELEEGELEIGQVSALVKNILPAADVVKEIWTGFYNLASQPYIKNGLNTPGNAGL